MVHDDIAGGAIQASGTENALNMGKNLIIAGLFVQLFFFSCFISVAIHFDIAMHKVHNNRAQSGVLLLVTLYLANVLIMIRSVFRVVEYLQGFSGYLLSYELYLYIFDAVLIWCVMVLFNLVHPSEVVARRGWKMEKIVGYQHVASDNSAGGFA